jgi:hypothetical protein
MTISTLGIDIAKSAFQFHGALTECTPAHAGDQSAQGMPSNTRTHTAPLHPTAAPLEYPLYG